MQHFAFHRQLPTANRQLRIMRWFPFFILAYIALGIQFGLSGYGILLNRPNLVLVVAIFVAVSAQRNAAVLACLLLGLTQDLLTHQSPLGLTAFAYGLIGLVVVNTQEIVDRNHFLTHIFLGLLGGLLYGMIVYLHGWIYNMIHPAQKLTHASIGSLVLAAFYTALLAPFVMGLLRRMKRMFGFRPLRMHGNGRI